MQFIEVANGIFVAVNHITAVVVSSYEEKQRPQGNDFGMPLKQKKTGEKIALKIKTSDGAEYSLDDEKSREAYPILFPDDLPSSV